MSESIIFTPIKINKLELPNRILMAPMVTHYAAQNGEMSEQLFNYHVERAKGGIGMNIVEATYMHKSGNSYVHGLSMADDYVIPGMQRFTKAMHDVGGHVAIQLQHGGRAVTPAISGLPRRLVSYAPGYTKYEGSTVLSIDEIEELIESYGQAAARAVECGFDAVDIHGAHGYLIAQFLSPLTNKREDQYGGSLENRMRFGVEVVRYVRKAVGPDFPVSFRISSDEIFPGGVGLEDAKIFANAVVDAGIDLLNVSATTTETGQYCTAPSCQPEGLHADRAKALRDAIGERALVAVVGRIHTRETAESILMDQKADLLVVGRQNIADPNFVNKLKDGRDKEIIPCVSCNEGCIWSLFKGENITCAVNPRAGLEAMYPEEKAPAAKNVVVVGAGPAGMEAALTAAKRGHKVTLFDKNDRIGGLVNVAKLPPYKGVFERLISYYETVLPKAGVTIALNTEADADAIKSLSPDLTIVATGSTPIVPGFCREADTMTAEEVLTGTPVGDNVIIFGGGLVGCETAEFLAEQGKKVTIIELRDALAMDMMPRNRYFLIQHLEKGGVNALVKHEILEVSADKKVKVRNEFKEEFWLEGFDTIILALGYRPNESLRGKLSAMGIKSIAIGDCLKAGKVMSSIRDGFLAGYNA